MCWNRQGVTWLSWNDSDRQGFRRGGGLMEASTGTGQPECVRLDLQSCLRLEGSRRRRFPYFARF